ncbi:MAG: GNAT family N-acetyltransferase [Alphaproteobacteria bacterium]|nr:GNAT family N-acetyltransferase [Alphaproteobacteria bacterium]
MHNNIAKIARLSDCPDALKSVESIFFESSSVQSFESEEARKAFKAKWLDYYTQNAPEDVLLAMSEKGEVMGYLSACFNSKAAKPLYDLLHFYGAFDEDYEDYPAHLHINVSGDFRSAGVGAVLIKEFLDLCRQKGAKGAHLITGPHARNIRFYERNGFLPVSIRTGRLLMGQKL